MPFTTKSSICFISFLNAVGLLLIFLSISIFITDVFSVTSNFKADVLVEDDQSQPFLQTRKGMTEMLLPLKGLFHPPYLSWHNLWKHESLSWL